MSSTGGPRGWAMMGDMPPAAPRARTGRPPRLTREEIIAAARRIIDADGVDDLTMRRLAREVGSTAMALYRHVRDKEDLLVLLLDDYAEQIPRPPIPAEPRDRILAVGTAMHDALAACSWIAEVLTSDALMSASALWYPETIIDACIDAGLTPEQSVHAYRTIWYYTAGEILVRAHAARRRREDPGPTRRDRIFAELDAEHLPRLTALTDRWTALTAQDTYREGLLAIVDGLLAGAR